MATLTAVQLKALKPSDEGKRLADGGSLYGIVRVSKVKSDAPKVSVLFRWRYRHDGKLQDYSCGTWPAVSLAEIRKARDEAQRLLATGVNPNDAKRQQRLTDIVTQKQQLAALEQQLARPTVRTLYEQWAASDLAARKDGGKETMRGLEKDVLPAPWQQVRRGCSPG